MERHFKQ